MNHCQIRRVTFHECNALVGINHNEAMEPELIQLLIEREFAESPLSDVELSINSFFALKGAVEIAVEQGDSIVGCMHVLQALFKLHPNVAGDQQIFLQNFHELLELHGVNEATLKKAFKASPAWGPKHRKHSQFGSIREFSPRLRQVLEHAVILTRMNDKDKNTLKTDMILTGILSEGTNAAADILLDLSRGTLTSETLTTHLGIDIRNVRPEFWIHTCYFETFSSDPNFMREPTWWTPQRCQLSDKGVAVDDTNVW